MFCLHPSLCYLIYGHNLFPYYFNIFYSFLVDERHGDHTKQQQLPHKNTLAIVLLWLFRLFLTNSATNFDYLVGLSSWGSPVFLTDAVKCDIKFLRRDIKVNSFLRIVFFDSVICQESCSVQSDDQYRTVSIKSYILSLLHMVTINTNCRTQ